MDSGRIAARAREIAYFAHGDQTDKAGRPYSEHFEFVAAHVSSEKEKCVAYLHDVLEDTDYPEEDLRREFGEEIFAAVTTMTHRKDEPYFDYIQRVVKNPISRAVKMADLTHNMMLERLPVVTEKDLRRLDKYREAYRMLEVQK